MKSKVPGVSDADYTKMHNSGLSDAQITALIKSASAAGAKAAGTVDVSGIKDAGAKAGATDAANAILANPTGSSTTTSVDTSPLAELGRILGILGNGDVLRIAASRSLLIGGGMLGVILGFVLLAAGNSTVQNVVKTGAKSGAKAAAAAAIL